MTYRRPGESFSSCGCSGLTRVQYGVVDDDPCMLDANERCIAAMGSENQKSAESGSIPIADFSAIDIVEGQQSGTRLPKTRA
jgi:hypothetical protein